MSHHNKNLTVRNNINLMKEPAEDHPDLTNIPNTTKGRNTLRKLYPSEVLKPAPKPYKVRPPKAQRAPNTPRKRKTHTHNPQKATHTLGRNTTDPAHH